MLHKQKESILALLKSDENVRNYETNYWFSYKDFFDPTDPFTEFSCENLDGKIEYIMLIENLLNADETAEIYVEVYGFEEDDEPFIYADTLIVFSKLSLYEIEQILNEPKNIFPSDIGEITDFSQQSFLVGNNGNLVPVSDLSNEGTHAYYCWWD